MKINYYLNECNKKDLDKFNLKKKNYFTKKNIKN